MNSTGGLKLYMDDSSSPEFLSNNLADLLSAALFWKLKKSIQYVHLTEFLQAMVFKWKVNKSFAAFPDKLFP